MKAFTLTNIGKVRSENQDCVWFISPKGGSYSILALCDGMGGAKAGSLASEIAISSFTSELSYNISFLKRNYTLEQAVIDSVNAANEKVHNHSFTDLKYDGMGTTLVAAVFKGKKCCVVNIGDSRAYLIRRSSIVQITRDHSFVEDLVEKGILTKEQALRHPKKNIITRALGVDKTVQSDIFTPKVDKGDILLLCSDGLSNMLTDKDILEISSTHNNLSDIGNELLTLTLSRGAPDNVTVGILQK